MKTDNKRMESSGEENMQQFLSEVRSIPRLSSEEEYALAKRCAEGDESAIRQMVKSNLRLVVFMASGYTGRGVSVLDLIQEGSIGLIAAARKYDYSMNLRFSTYAAQWIRKRITQCLSVSNGLIRVPAHTAEKMQKLAAARSGYIQEYGREPEAEELSQMTGIPVEKTEALLNLYPEIVSLDVSLDEKSGATLSSAVEDFRISQPEESLVHQELETTIHGMLQLLPERQQQILRLHFGLDDGHAFSLEEIAEQMILSKERVRQIERQAINKLHELGADIGLEDFLE